MKNIGRRFLIGLGALALSAPRALADTNFTSFGFAATGGNTNRTDPARWADWINVKDYGAKGDSTTDDTAAIQAAFAAVLLQPGGASLNGAQGKVYFPAGTYKVTSAISVLTGTGPCTVEICGDGPGSCVEGNFAGYIFDNLTPATGNAAGGPFHIHDLAILNSNTTANSGAVRVGFVLGLAIECCSLKGFNVVNIAGTPSFGANSTGAFSTQVRSCAFNCSAPSSTAGSFAISGQNGVLIVDCDIAGFDNGIRIWSTGFAIIGGRFEVNQVGIMIGMEADGTVTAAQGGLITGMSFESNNTAIYLRDAFQVTMTGFSISAGGNGPGGAAGCAYGIRGDGATRCVTIGLSIGGMFNVAAILAPNDPATSFISTNAAVTASSGGYTAGVAWSQGTTAQCQYLGCNIGQVAIAFANAPASPVLGQTQWFSDSNTATFGATIAAGGANKVLGVFGGTNWTVMAKA